MWKVSIKILGNSKYGAWRKDLYSNFAKEKVYIRGDFMENNDDKRYTGKGNKVTLYNLLEYLGNTQIIFILKAQIQHRTAIFW